MHGSPPFTYTMVQRLHLRDELYMALISQDQALFDLAPVLFISQSFSLYHSQPSHSIALRPNIVIQCLGISLLQISFVWLVFAGTLNLLTHFLVIISSHCTVYIFIYVIISFLCEEIVIVIVVQRGSNPVAAQTRVGVMHSDLLCLVHGSATEC